ncbi:MAG TPA: cell division protein CrgA [Mycobacteriales bacterium]|nr:cell division protein CrgA [Mycobacteriales bacterium]
MPKSRTRKKKSDVYTPPTTLSGPRKKGPSPRWVGPAVLGLLLIGVLWLVVAYISEASVPIQRELGNGNVLVGFGFIAAGFALATQWR